MSAVGQSDSAVIDRVCIRAASNEAVAVRQRVEGALRNATLRPSRLPSSAILFVRKLRDATPALRLSDYNSTQVLEWERSLNSALDRLASESIRAADSAVPASAEAVLFADRAEMLACFALDWLHGTAAINWWWRTLLRRDDPETAVAREWTSSPEFVPLALEHLAEGSRAVAFARRISEELAATLLRRVLYVFAVPAGRKSEPCQRSVSAPIVSFLAEKKAMHMPDSGRPPWSYVVPEADAPALSPAKRVLLAQALMLRRAPATVRGIIFQTEILNWELATTDAMSPTRLSADGVSPEQLQHREMPPPQLAEPNSRAEPGVSATGLANSAVPGPAAIGHVSSEEDVPRSPNAAYDTLLRTSITTDHAIPSEPAQQAAPSGFRTPSPVGQAQSESLQTADLIQRAVIELEVTEATADATAVVPAKMASGAEQRVQSALAGVFFLTNVAQSLGLYSDFSSPQGNNLELDIWDFLALLARQFVREEIYADGLNFVLAALAGRSPTQSPGESFDPPLNWDLPSGWLDAFPESFEWKEVIHDRRMHVEHPAGFLLKDEAPACGDNRAGSLQRWLNWVGHYVRARLVRAFCRDDAAEFLCRVPGKIEIRPMHVDVYYSLQTYPTEIRLAGLDRDPGWIPAAGHYVAYHFD